ncbi:MAG: type II toxin-antitoxin system VapC family toxin [Candidatus Dormibacteraceae bacterium]
MILLDTHALLWWIEDQGHLPKKLTKRVARELPILVSPVSFWELAMLVERGRVSIDRNLLRWTRELLHTGQVEVAELTPQAAIIAAQLKDFRGDPADRLIYATAGELKIALISKDRQMHEHSRRYPGVQVLWESEL